MGRHAWIWRMGILITGWAVLLLLMVWFPTMAQAEEKNSSLYNRSIVGTVQAQGALTPIDPVATALTRAQLTQQINKLQLENNWFWNNSATFITTAGVAIVGIFGIIRWFGDRDDEREKQRQEQMRWLRDRQIERQKRREEQDHWLADRHAEREKQADERFQLIVDGLGAENPAKRAGAAIELRTFLDSGYERFYDQVFDLAVANLRLLGRISSPPNEELKPLKQALIIIFKNAFRCARDLPRENIQFSSESLDASEIYLDAAILAGADLKNAWMPGASLLKADLRGANLNHVNLKEAHLAGANLTEASLINGTTLTNADLTDAVLRQANLLDAVLNNAVFTRADLTGADLSGAFLLGANPEAAQSLKDAKLDRVIGLTSVQCKACRKKGASVKDPVKLTNISSFPTVN